MKRQERIEGLLAETGRRIVPIRTSFVQQGHGAETKPGPLHKFLTAHDERGLDAYLLVHAMAAVHPWNCRLPSQVWVSALGLDETASASSARTAVSKIMGRLESRDLIKRERSKRLSDVILLREDGSAEPFERPVPDRVEDRWLQLPYAYWLGGYYKTLSLPAKVMLLVALFRPKDGFPMPYEKTRRWYGVSSDSSEEGLRELRKVGLLAVESNWVPAPRSAIDWTEELLYTLQGPFSKAERVKASRFRSRATTVPDAEVPTEQVAPVWKPTLVEFMTGKAPTPVGSRTRL